MYSFRRSRLVLLVVGAFTLAVCNRSPTNTAVLPSNNAARPTQVVLTQPINKYLLIVPVVIGGQRYRFVFDTGAAITVVNNRLASKLTQPVQDKDVPAILHEGVTHGVATPGGALAKTDVTFWRAQPITIGNQTISGVMPWLGADLSSMKQTEGQKIDGIIGSEFLRQLTWQVDNKTRTLTVWNGTPPITGFEHCVPYQSSYSQPPQLKIDTQQGLPLVFNIDTGATGAFVSQEVLKALREGGTTLKQVGTSELSTIAGNVSAPDYLINDLVFNGVPLGSTLATQSTGGVDNLGMGFLSRFDKYLLAPFQMLFCYNAGNLGLNDTAVLREIHLVYHNGKVEIGESDAAGLSIYGLEQGDVVLMVDKRTVQPTDIGELRQMLYKAPIGTLEIAIERKGVKKTVTL
jgi:predicted aspartyl protease